MPLPPSGQLHYSTIINQLTQVGLLFFLLLESRGGKHTSVKPFQETNALLIELVYYSTIYLCVVVYHVRSVDDMTMVGGFYFGSTLKLDLES